MTPDLAEEFAGLRPQLVGAAYRVLSSVADAEDVVQDAWLRWAEVDRSQVENARAYLLTTVARLAINRVRQQQRRRETYVGPWLPEPLVTTEDDPALTGAGAVELAESVSMAMLVVLESLSPLERAAFVLHDVFGLEHSEVATALDRSPAATRQLVHRARSHVQARRPRHVVDRQRHREVVAAFADALGSGDLEACLAALSPEVVLTTDGGGLRKAALRPILGPEKVVRFLAAVLGTQDPHDYVADFREVNGELAVVGFDRDRLDSIIFVTVEEEGITAIRILRNPEKLDHLTLPPPGT